MDGPHVQYAKEVVAKNPLAAFLGIRLEEVRRAYARLSVVIKPECLVSAKASPPFLLLLLPGPRRSKSPSLAWGARSNGCRTGRLPSAGLRFSTG